MLRHPSASTACYAAVLDSRGDCKFGIGDFNIHDELTVDVVRLPGCFETSLFYLSNISHKKVRQFEEDIARSRLLIMDGNVALPTMKYILDVCRSARVPGRTTIKTTLVSKAIERPADAGRFGSRRRPRWRF